MVSVPSWFGTKGSRLKVALVGRTIANAIVDVLVLLPTWTAPAVSIAVAFATTRSGAPNNACSRARYASLVSGGNQERQYGGVLDTDTQPLACEEAPAAIGPKETDW